MCNVVILFQRDTWELTNHKSCWISISSHGHSLTSLVFYAAVLGDSRGRTVVLLCTVTSYNTFVSEETEIYTFMWTFIHHYYDHELELVMITIFLSMTLGSLPVVTWH